MHTLYYDMIHRMIAWTNIDIFQIGQGTW